MRSQQENTYDAIVVGSGMSGGWAAKELCEKGLKTLVLERGRNVVHIDDYPTAGKAPWELPYGNELTVQEKKAYYASGKVYNCKQDTKHFFVNDSEHPYEQVRPFDWMRGYQVGGRSLMWARHSFRWSNMDFEANTKEGIGIDWPIRYKDIEPWYDHVERFAGISGENHGLSQLPDQQLLPPLEMNCVEKEVRERIAKEYDDRVMIVARAAVLTQPHEGRGACRSRNQCARGCPDGAYFSSNSSTLPAAAKTGNLTLRPFSIAHSLIYDQQKDKAVGVRVIDTQTKERTDYFAKVIFLNAGALNTTAILMNSKSDRYPDGFGNDSGVLGRYLMDHQEAGGAYGIWEGFEDRYDLGRKPNGMYIPRFRNVTTSHPDFTRGFAYECYTNRQGWSRGNYIPGFGVDFKNQVTKPGPWGMFVVGYGEVLPDYSNYMTIDSRNLDPFGMPTIQVSMEFGPNEVAMRRDMESSAIEILERGGLKQVFGVPIGTLPGGTIHEMGTARMGKDPRESVLNKWNQVHTAPNVFVTDGACMVSTACQNPSLTYMALTARAANYAVEQLKKGVI